MENNQLQKVCIKIHFDIINFQDLSFTILLQKRQNPTHYEK